MFWEFNWSVGFALGENIEGDSGGARHDPSNALDLAPWLFPSGNSKILFFQKGNVNVIFLLELEKVNPFCIFSKTLEPLLEEKGWGNGSQKASERIRQSRLEKSHPSAFIPKYRLPWRSFEGNSRTESLWICLPLTSDKDSCFCTVETVLIPSRFGNCLHLSH